MADSKRTEEQDAKRRESLAMAQLLKAHDYVRVTPPTGEPYEAEVLILHHGQDGKPNGIVRVQDIKEPWIILDIGAGTCAIIPTPLPVLYRLAQEQSAAVTAAANRPLNPRDPFGDAADKAGNMTGHILLLDKLLSDLTERKAFEQLGQLTLTTPYQRAANWRPIVALAKEIAERSSHYFCDYPDQVPGYDAMRVQNVIALGKILALLEA